MTFILEKDPNNILKLHVGDCVEFTNITDDIKIHKIFKGFIFILGTDSTEAYKVTAYDQLRYLKNEDTMAISGLDDKGVKKPQTISDLFTEICNRNQITNKKINYQVNYQLLPKIQNNKSYFAMLDEAIDETLRYSDTGSYFFIHDDFGTLTLDEVSLCKTDYIIGDESMLTDYKYEIDIDTDTYNRIKVMKEDNEKGISIDRIESSNESIMKYGVLQKIIDGGNMKPNQLDLYTKFYLKMKNRVIKTIQLDALGIDGLYAGYGFTLQLRKLNIHNLGMFIVSATHRYDNGMHTMSLDVSGLPVDKPIVQHKYSQVIYDIVAGKYGNGEIRKAKLISEFGEDGQKLIQEEVNKVYYFAWEVMDGSWEGQVIKEGEYIYRLTPQLKKDLYDLGYDVDLLDKILHSTYFKPCAEAGRTIYVEAYK